MSHKIKLAGSTIILLALSVPAHCLTQWGGVGLTGFASGFSSLNDTLVYINGDYLNAEDKVGFSDPLYMASGEGGVAMGVFTIAARGGGMMRKAAGEELQASAGYAAGFVESGLLLRPVRWLWFRPSLEACASWFEVELDELNAEDNPYREVIRSAEFGLGGGLSVHLNLPLSRSNVLGVCGRAGYIHPVYTRWRDLDGQIDPVEGFGLRGLYIKLGIILGRKHREPNRISDDSLSLRY